MKNLERIVQDNIQYFREKLGLSQEQLAEKAGISKIYLAEMESHRRKPSIPMMEKLATALEIEAFMLLVKDPEAFVSVKDSQNAILDRVIAEVERMKV